MFVSDKLRVHGPFLATTYTDVMDQPRADTFTDCRSRQLGPTLFLRVPSHMPSWIAFRSVEIASSQIMGLAWVPRSCSPFTELTDYIYATDRIQVDTPAKDARLLTRSSEHSVGFFFQGDLDMHLDRANIQ